jgi:hypothetical protein
MPATRLQRNPSVQCPVPEEDFLMTFQVALSAYDGWIMASDTQETRFAGIASGGIRETTNTKKITHDSLSGTTYMVSGDDIGRIAASDIAGQLRSFDGGKAIKHDWLEANLPEIATATWKRMKANRRPPSPRQIIMAVQNFRPLWEIWVAKESKAQVIQSKTFGGDATNSAKFFVEEYYDHEATVQTLLPLAAHSVLMAGKRNPSGVGGLEITFWEGGMVEWNYDSPELARLSERSNQIDEYIRKQLVDGTVIL